MIKTKTRISVDPPFLFWLTIIYVLSLCQIIRAQKPDDLVAKYFQSLDSTLQAISQSKELQSPKIKYAEEFLLNYAKWYPEFKGLIKTDNKGAVFNEIVDGKSKTHNFRNIGGQSWFKKVRNGLKPHYGNFVLKDTPYLFWVRPIISGNQGDPEFMGVIVAKIDLPKCFVRISDEHKLTFRARLDKRVLFSNLVAEKSDIIEMIEISVHGLSGIQVEFRQEGIKAELDSSLVAANQAKANTSAGTGTGTPGNFDDFKSSALRNIIIMLIVIISSLFLIIFFIKKYKPQIFLNQEPDRS